MKHVKTHPDAAPVEVPKDAKLSSDPIEGGVCIVNAAVPTGEDGHTVWRTLIPKDRAQRERDASASVTFHRANAILFLRLRRDAMLRATDFTQLALADSTLTDAERKAWAGWRQQLRDLPADIADPEWPKWPEPPSPLSVLLEWRSLWPSLEWRI